MNSNPVIVCCFDLSQWFYEKLTIDVQSPYYVYVQHLISKLLSQQSAGNGRQWKEVVCFFNSEKMKKYISVSLSEPERFVGFLKFSYFTSSFYISYANHTIILNFPALYHRSNCLHLRLSCTIAFVSLCV